MHSNDTALSHASSHFQRWGVADSLNQVFPFRTMDILHGMVNLTQYERHFPRIPLSDSDIKDVIRLLRGVNETTDNNATYNFEDTFETNLFKITGPFGPDNMEEAQTMRFQVMKLLIACPSSVTNDLRNVVTGVRRWAKRLRCKRKDHAWSDFMLSKFQHHIEEGPLSDIEIVPSSQISNNFSTSTYGPTGNKINATDKSSQRSQAPRDSKTTTYSTTHVSSLAFSSYFGGKTCRSK